MNKTTAFLSVAGALALIALIVKIPGPQAAPTPPPAPQAQPIVVVQPLPEPPKPIIEPSSQPGSLRLTGKLSHPYVVPGASDVFMNLEVSGVEVPGAKRAPVNIALVIDRSGSMAGEKIAQAKRAARQLVDQLNATDRLAIVEYGTDVNIFRGEFATEDNKDRMRRFIARIEDNGGTNIAGALQAGRAQVQAARSDFSSNRIMLITDGQPTVGMTSRAGLVRLASDIKTGGITVTALGVGYDFNEDLMQQMASVGGGSYGYLRDASAIAGILQRDLQQATTLVARDVRLNITLPEGVDSAEALGRPSTNSGNVLSIPMPDFSAGQVERLVVRVRANPKAGSVAQDIGSIKLDYQDVLAERAADANLKLAAAVTLDSSLALKNTDRDTLVVATRARSAQNVRRAAELVQRGDNQGARRELDQAAQNFDEISTIVGGASIEADKKQIDGFKGAAGRAAAPAAQNDLGKSLKVESMRNSGYGVSAY
jgi:Ca-activated chloride channel family protein